MILHCADSIREMGPHDLAYPRMGTSYKLLPMLAKLLSTRYSASVQTQEDVPQQHRGSLLAQCRTCILCILLSRKHIIWRQCYKRHRRSLGQLARDMASPYARCSFVQHLTLLTSASHPSKCHGWYRMEGCIRPCPSLGGADDPRREGQLHHWPRQSVRWKPGLDRAPWDSCPLSPRWTIGPTSDPGLFAIPGRPGSGGDMGP